MERSGAVKSVCILMMLLVIGGECEKGRFGSFMECYEANYSICALLYTHVYCAAKALADCTGLSQPSHKASLLVDMVSPKQRYCELGCALSRCTNISTQHDPKGEEVAKCFESCSEITCKPKTSNAPTSGNDRLKTKTTDEQTIHDFCKLGCQKTICGETAEKYDHLHFCGRSCTMPCS